MGVRKGELGLEFLKNLNPDVLLLDLMLPDMDGWQLYHQMKADKMLSKVPVVIVSARNPDRDKADGHYVTGKDRFIQKPFEVAELVAAVNQVLENGSEN